MNLLITGALQNADEYIKKIECAGHSVIFLGQEKDELPCSYDWVEGVICNALFLFHPIEKFKNLTYIQLTSAGFDRVPMDYVREKGITIHNARGVYSIPMAEFAFCGVLQLYKKSKFFLENQKNHLWQKNRTLTELFGKNACIVGCGSVGTECAKRFRAFGCNVAGIDVFPVTNDEYDKIYGLDCLDEVLDNTDILILTVPLTDETKGLIDSKRLSRLKDGSVLVNIARGAVVDTDALIKHIDRLGGAVLDVFDEEPLSENSGLWDIENIIITPHNSFVGNGNGERLFDVIMANLGVN